MQAATSAQAIYTFTRSALRAQLLQTLLLTRRADWRIHQDTAAAIGEIRLLLGACRTHLVIEHDLAGLTSGSQPATVGQHLDRRAPERDLEDLMQLTVETEYGTWPERGKAGQRLYHRLALFAATHFSPLDEPWESDPACWNALIEGELATLDLELAAPLPNALKLPVLRWVLPQLAPADRANVLKRLREGATDEVFHTVLDILQPSSGGKPRLTLVCSLQEACHG